MFSTFDTILIVASATAFLIYGIMIFSSSRMHDEFKRFRLEEFKNLVGFLELTGAIGLILGLIYYPILLIASGGLAILMLLGFAVRLKIKDGFWVSLPALIFMIVNLYIFISTFKTNLVV